jgi:hypothetical protein
MTQEDRRSPLGDLLLVSVLPLDNASGGANKRPSFEGFSHGVLKFGLVSETLTADDQATRGGRELHLGQHAT